MFTPRNNIEINSGYCDKEVAAIDTLYDICDAEFNSRIDVHNSIETASGENSWARYYLLHEVRKIAMRENLYVSYHMTYVVAKHIARDWYAQRESV